MIIESYVTQAMRSLAPNRPMVADRALVALSMEVLIGAAALADLLKKQLVYGKAIDRGAMNSALELVKDMAETAVSHAGAEVSKVQMQPALTHAALGLFGEAGELLEALHEAAEEGAELDATNVVEELGDAAWYLALGMHEMDEVGVATPTDVLTANIAKLKARYPDKFTLEASEGRNVIVERAVLEQHAGGVDVSDGGNPD